MNENAQRWIDALRSGEFKQGTRRLRKEDHFCCLGVACELYRHETARGEWNGSYFQVGTQPGEESNIDLPQPVADWLGLTWRDGHFYDETSALKDNRGKRCDYLTSRNDSGATFEQIADLIESEPNGLFR